MLKAVIARMVDGFCGCRYVARVYRLRDDGLWVYTGGARFCKTLGDAYKWCIDDRGVSVADIKEVVRS